MRLQTLLLLFPIAVSSLRMCFDKTPNRSLFARPLLSLRNLSLEKCFSACLEMPRETCKSITYTTKTSNCQLNGKSKQNVKIVKNPMSDFYHRTCFDKPSVAIRRDTVATDSGCFTSTPGKVLIGIVDQLVRDVATVADCQAQCTNSQTKYDVTCKSAMYYEKDKECILASQSKADIPDLFIDDDKSLYLENGCLDKSDKSVVVKTSEVFKGSSKFSENESSKDGELEPFKPEKTTLSSILSPSGTHTDIQLSGYEGPSDSVSNQNREDLLTTRPTTTTTTTTTTTPKPIAPKVIDNYNVVNTPKTQEYGRRLRDTRVKSCFREVRPMGKMEALRVVKAYSLEQCTDMCRLCTKCLVKQKKCQAVAFDISRELCALATKRLTDGGSFNDDIIYHNRMDC
uniref:Apple domain-containing protein n=1 Tax=Caenorhabditis tropicalis TaxID=1561998 RepID=A0A1I7V489_9PELO